MALASVGLAGCPGDSDTVRAELAARDSTWNRQLAAIKASHGVLAARLAEIGIAGVPPDRASTKDLLRARVASLAQSLIDVDNHRRQIGPRVEQALRSVGAGAAEKALDDESARMDEQLKALAIDMETAKRAVDALTERPSIGRTAP